MKQILYKDGKRRIQGSFTLSPFFIDTCTGFRYRMEDRKQNIKVTGN